MIAERGTTSLIHHVEIMDSTSTTGGRKTGLAFDTSGLVCRYIRPGETLSAAITLETIATLGTYAAPTSNAHMRFKQVDATNWPGLYEIHIHNDWVNVTNSRRALRLTLLGATGMVQCSVEILLTGANLNDGVRAGLTALPNAAADGAGGLPISDAGGLDLDGRLDAAVSSRSTLTTAEVNTQCDTAIADAALATATALATVDGIVDDILADTATLPTTVDGLTPTEWARGLAAALLADATGLGTGAVSFKKVGTPATERIAATIVGGARTVTLSLT